MDGGDGWHVGSLGGGQKDKPIINQVMLRFRPIAPKPATGSSGLLTENKNQPFLSKARTKRKYVRIRKRNSGYKRKKMVPPENSKDGLDKKILTLQLLPETVEKKDLNQGDSWPKADPTADRLAAEEIQDREPQRWLNNKQWIFTNVEPSAGSDPTLVMAQMRVVESWVTVESVTDKCMDVRRLGCTDVERVKNLERDTCPGFISDGSNGVQWVNEAYKRIVSEEIDGQPLECKVRLLVKEKLPYSYPAFTAQVRMQHTGRSQMCSKVMPCDVWRMDFGGFAWRLDIKAALSLGL